MYFINREECTGCSACYAVCPGKCIRMEKDKEGFLYPEVDEKKCISCGKCEKVCPAINRSKSNENVKKEEAYVVCHNEQSIRRDSASGGAFTMFAQFVLQQGGIVCGAGYDDELNVVHKVCEEFDSLDELRGSKYVQSKMGDIYERIKLYLDQEKYVLFTGTPCQVEGLLRYLGRAYERLITVDIACFGVASPSLWKKYINDEEKRYKKAIINKRSRDKSQGWRNWGMLTEFNDGSKVNRVYYKDSYINVYHSYNAMRYSCYQCKFRNIFNKGCDASMADCWGIEYFAPEMDDDLGASIIFLHSEKIKNLWTQISSCVNAKKINPYRALQGNFGAWGGGK